MRLSTAIASMAIVLFDGCVAPESGDGPVECNLDAQLSQAARSPGGHQLVLLACPLQPEVAAGDPVEVRVALANVADTVIRVRPSFVFGTWLDARVQGPDGEPLQRVGYINAMREPAVDLAPLQIIDSVVDLRCGLPGDPLRGLPCAAAYDFGARGRYTVEMTYSALCDHGPCEPGLLRIEEISAPRFEIVVR